MKISKIMLTLFILLAILTATAVSATEDVENMTVQAALDEIESNDVDTVLKTDEKEQLEEKTDLEYNKGEILSEVSEEVTGNESSTDFALNVHFPKNVYRNTSNYFDVYIPEGADGALKLYINDNTAGEWNVFDYLDDWNSFNIYIENPKPTNTWKVTYTDDSIYPDTFVNGTFEFKWVELPEETDLSGNFHIDIEDQKGVLIFLIDGKQVFNDFFNGNAWVSYDNLTVGNHSYEIILYDNSNKLVLDENGTFKADYSFIPFMKDEYPLVDTLVIPISLPDDATGNVIVSYNGVNYTGEVNDGMAYVTLRNLELGEKEIVFTYLGDDKYSRKTVRNNISIEGYAIIPYENPGNCYISLTLPSDAKGKLNISLLNDEGSIKEFLGSLDLVDGTAQYILPPGNHYLRAEYNGTDYDVEPLDAYQFNVFPDIQVSPVMILGENIIIEVFASNATENVKINIEDYYSRSFYLDENGRETLDVTFEPGFGIKLGVNRIAVFYNDTQLVNDMGMPFEVRFTVLPGIFTVPEVFGSDKSANMTLNLSKYAKGNISVYAWDEEYQQHTFAQNVSVSGNASVPLSADKPGYYQLQIVYVDEKYGEFSTMTQAYVPKPDAGADVVIPQKVTSDTLEINLPKNATGSILAIIDGKSQIHKLVNGSAKIDLSDLSEGPHNLTIKYTGDGNYEAFEKTATMTVPTDLKLDVTVEVDDFGNVEVTATAEKNATGNVTIAIINATGHTIKNVTGELENGSFTLGGLGFNLNSGLYNFTASYGGDVNYNPATAEHSTMLTKDVPTFDAVAYVHEYGFIIVNATINNDATGNVTFRIVREGEDPKPEDDVTVALDNGTAVFDDINQYAKGKYLIYVTYNGDRTYYMAYQEFLEVNINKTYISPNTTQLDVEGGEVNVTVDLGVNATGVVHVVYPSGYVDNVTIENGKVNFYSVFMKETGPISLVLDYDGDNDYYGFYEYFVDFTIKKATFITAKPISVVYKNNAKWTISLKDAEIKPVSGQTIKVTVNGKTYTGKTDAKGNAVVTIPANMLPKAYTAKIVYAGTALLDDDFENVKFTVKKATPKLTAKKKTFKAKTKVKKYTVVLKDHKKKAMKKAKVTLKVKGKTYKATTNAKGKAVFKIKNLKKKGTYKAKITFKATKYFNKVAKNVKIKVKK